MKLYSYFRSSASFRVRIVLNLKQQPVEIQAVHLLRQGGEQHLPDYLALNPLGLVPMLATAAGPLTQSLAICEYLNERYPEPALLPSDLFARAIVRSTCNLVSCDIHPLNNLRVLNYLAKTADHDEAGKLRWYQHWISEGFAALEQHLKNSAGLFCHGDVVTLADAFVVPQIWTALRFHCDMASYPTLQRVYAHAMTLPEFQLAAPALQPDAE